MSTSFCISRAINDYDPEAIRELVRLGKKRGVIKDAAAPSAPTGKSMTVGEMKSVVAQAKADGLIKQIPTQEAPAPVVRSGRPILTGDARGITSQWMDVDPDLAAHWLQNNFVNRTLSEDVITAYARDMTNGVWVQTHQGIAFNDKDHLIDGQHRLHAIIKCGITVRMMVTFGLPSAIEGREMTTMDAVDRGRTRSVADQLKIQHGMRNGSTIAAVSMTIGSLCNDAKTRRLSVGQTLEIYRAFQGGIDYAIQHRSTAHGLRSAGVLAAFAFAYQTLPEKIAPLYKSLISGERITLKSPLDHLRNFLLSDEAKLLSRGTDRGISELVLEALRLHLTTPYIATLNPDPAGATHFRTLNRERVAAICSMFQIS